VAHTYMGTDPTLAAGWLWLSESVIGALAGTLPFCFRSFCTNPGCPRMLQRSQGVLKTWIIVRLKETPLRLTETENH